MKNKQINATKIVMLLNLRHNLQLIEGGQHLVEVPHFQRTVQKSNRTLVEIVSNIDTSNTHDMTGGGVEQ